MKHKLFSFLLAVVASVGTMNAEIKNGTCGTNLTWSLNTEDSTLTIQGTGAMSNYNLSNNPAPWRQDSAYIKHLIFENGITSIGTYAFYNCTNLISVSIPNSVESIGNYAFQFCSNLPFVTIPQNVTSIGKQAFRGCSGLKWFACKAVTPPTLGSDVFYGVHRKTPMFVPSASIDEYKNAAWWSEFVNYISSWGDCGDNLMWYLNTIDSTLTIQGTGAMTDYTSSSSVPWYSDRSSIKSISLPDGLTTIGGYAFSGCTGLTSVTIGNRVTSIGGYAFSGCTGLTSITLNSNAIVGKYYTYTSSLRDIFGSQVTEYIIGDNVTSIGTYAFYGCSGLTSVTIGNSVTSIGGYAFVYCTGLTSVTLNSNAIVGKNYTYTSSLKDIFGSQVTEYIIGDNVKGIGEGAFKYCTGLTSVTIPNSVTSIGNSAFYNCSGLTSVTIPNSVTSIGSGTFSDCTGLTSVTIGNSVTSIGGSAFKYCTGLTSVTIGNSVTSIGYDAFYGCTGLTSVTIPNSVTSIGEGAFLCCSGLTSIIVENGNSVYDSRNNCNAIIETATNTLIVGCKNTIIPNSVTSIGDNAFIFCTGLTSVTIPNSVTSIGEGAFVGCSGLTSIIVENGNSVYDSRNNCNAIIETATNTLIVGCKNTIIPNSVTSIRYDAFYGCTGLTSVTIPNSVTSIGGYAFYECSGLTSVTIGNSVTRIGNLAFAYCTGLTSVTIPNSVTSIGYSAFKGCSSLTSVTCFATTPPQLDSYEGAGVDKSIPLYVPAGSISTYQSSDDWKGFTNILPIGAQPVDVTTTTVTPSETTADIAWPQVTGTATYTIEIKKNGELICTLTFNAQGQLISIAFAAPSVRNNTPEQIQQAGFEFTVNGLEPGTTYNYTVTSKNASGGTINVKNGTFTTLAPTGIEDVLANPSAAKDGKVLHDGQIYILRDGKVYDLTGREIM